MLEYHPSIWIVSSAITEVAVIKVNQLSFAMLMSLLLYSCTYCVNSTAFMLKKFYTSLVVLVSFEIRICCYDIGICFCRVDHNVCFSSYTQHKFQKEYLRRLELWHIKCISCCFLILNKELLSFRCDMIPIEKTSTKSYVRYLVAIPAWVSKMSEYLELKILFDMSALYLLSIYRDV